ncbi:hypothetical protein [Streptomyces sp. RerS4]|uniref:hypothetical protein n=1 Tax=Streptomyces sp. RerS4 TaxID=2942449 RepID=UPI00201B9B3E|nr:hypothetical protein [Streptomyces sp. RerS4]UQX02498.1 hypothetical protein M4D82_19905 [Streptomyces sp. RerS4]
MDHQQFQTVLHWHHRRAGAAHALLRASYDPATRQAVAVVSELADNPDDRGITDDFASVATAALPVLREGLSPDIAAITWIAHFGPFSYVDPSGPETFTALTLTVTADGYRDDLQGDRRLTADEVTALLGGAPLAPVAEALAVLGHPR